MMQQVFFLEEQRGFSSLNLKQISVPDPKEDEVLIKHTAISINFIDYEYCYGKLPLPKTPIILGIEAVGTIEKLGAQVKSYNNKQRVGYGTASGGAFAEYRTIKQDLIFPIPDEISDEAVASNMTKGMTAHYLLRRTFFVRPEMYILILGASSCTASYMMNLAKYYNAKVIAAVENPEKHKNLKAKCVTDYKRFVQDVQDATNKEGVEVVYDFLGGDYLSKSIEVMSTFGLLVSAGQIIKPVSPIDISLLSKKSLFLTSPKLQTYKQNKQELFMSALEVFGLIQLGVLPKKAQKIYKFSEIPQAIQQIATRTNYKPSIVML